MNGLLRHCKRFGSLWWWEITYHLARDRKARRASIIVLRLGLDDRARQFGSKNIRQVAIGHDEAMCCTLMSREVK